VKFELSDSKLLQDKQYPFPVVKLYEQVAQLLSSMAQSWHKFDDPLQN
jgi:hypothetical protein